MTFSEATTLVAKYDGSVQKAAKAAGMSRQNLYRILGRGDVPKGKSGHKRLVGRKKVYERVKVASAGKVRIKTKGEGSFAHRMLKDILDTKRSSPREIATALGISEVTIDKLRSRSTAFPSLPIAVGLERMFGIRCASWLEEP